MLAKLQDAVDSNGQQLQARLQECQQGIEQKLEAEAKAHSQLSEKLSQAQIDISTQVDARFNSLHAEIMKLGGHATPPPVHTSAAGPTPAAKSPPVETAVGEAASTISKPRQCTVEVPHG